MSTSVHAVSDNATAISNQCGSCSRNAPQPPRHAPRASIRSTDCWSARPRQPNRIFVSLTAPSWRSLSRARPAPGTTPEVIARASAKRLAQRHQALTADIAHIVMQRSDNEERQWILHAETVPELRHAPKRLLDPQSQVKRLTPPGPTNSPTTMSTIPQRIWRRNSAKMPAITRITAMIQRIVAMVLLHFIQRRRAVRP